MARASPEVAHHLAGETAVLRSAIADAGLAVLGAVAILWVDGDAPVVLRGYAIDANRLDALADMYPDGPADLWLPEDWDGALALPDASAPRRRAAGAARRALRAEGVPAREVLATVLGALAASLNDDSSALGVPTARHFFAFASHHDVDEALFDVLARDASPAALAWLRERDLLRFADPFP